MDFKIAGTQNGITGIQLDLKIDGISEEIIRATLAQSREARIEILRTMLVDDPAAAAEDGRVGPAAAPHEDRPREDRPADRPRRQDDPRHPGRRRRARSTSRTTARSPSPAADEASAKAGLARVEALTATVQVGRIYDGTVTSVKDFGAFVEILPGQDGLCHISELADGYVDSVGDVCTRGRRDAGEGDRHRRPGPREAEPQGRDAELAAKDENGRLGAPELCRLNCNSDAQRGPSVGAGRFCC